MANAPTLPETSAPPRPETLPDRVGRFAIAGRLGVGGMGVVLVGRDATLGRDVALKLLSDDAGGAATNARMLREAQAMARVTHPNVVPVYEIGAHGAGIYIAMELVKGQPLAEWLEAPRTVVEILEKLSQAGRGLAAAHAVGILHRDFKPANVLVGEDGRARVADFGLARKVSASELDEAPDATTSMAALGISEELTREGAIVGTPSYMSPEQLHGAPTEASDQWSFAVTLYRALYGVLPFRGEGILGLMEAIVKGPAPVPPARADVPLAVRDAILRALRRDPDERWPSVAALVDALEEALRVDPDRDPLRSRRQRRLLAMVVLAFAIVVGTVGATKSDLGRTMTLAFATRLSALGVGAVGLGALLFRRSVLRDGHGSRLVLVYFLMISGVTAHRLINLASGAVELVPVLRGDAVLVATLAILAASTLERWLGWIAVLMGGYVAVTFALDRAAVSLFGLALLGSIALAIHFWREPSRPLLRTEASGERGGRSTRPGAVSSSRARSVTKR